MTYGRLRHVLDALASLSMLIASLVVIWILLFKVTDRAPAPPITGNTVHDITNQSIKLRLDETDGTRPDGAKVAIIEFTDFDCPFCARHARETLPALKREFVDSGRLAYGVSHHPIERLHPTAVQAAAHATCAAEQGKFWEMHELLFERRGTTPRSFGDVAGRLQLDSTKLKQCLLGASDRIRRRTEARTRSGVTSTPMFYLGVIEQAGMVAVRRQIKGAADFGTFKKVIEELLAGG